mmetsp:Transcript_121836/g.389604  ORF Transcript_121836/g.389604 Transcript_121836/m.389604 type:complete len:398 (-) Transcript_121836:447-1640(-)
MPEETVILVPVARRQACCAQPIFAGAGAAVEAKTLPNSFLPEFEDLSWDQPCVLVQRLEALQEPREWPTFEAVPHCPDVAHIAVPRTEAKTPAPIPHVEVREVAQLLRELPIPTVDRTGTVGGCVAHRPIPGPRGECAQPPHMRHGAVFRRDDLAATEPNTQGLVQILATPAQHLLIVATSLEPPTAGHAEEAARDDGDVDIVRVEPLEIGVPSQVALGPSTSSLVVLRPCVDVQVCDLRNDHPPVVLANEFEEGSMPFWLGSHMAIKEHDDVSRRGVSPCLLCLNQADGPGVSQHLGLVLALYILIQIRLCEGRAAAIVHHDDLVKDLWGCRVEHCLHCLQRILPLLGTWQDHRYRLWVPNQSSRICVDDEVFTYPICRQRQSTGLAKQQYIVGTQ